MAPKLNITVTEVGVCEFGTPTARSRGMVVTLSGHYTIEGREVVRFGQTYREICGACDGTGYRPGYGFSDGSRCWPCNYTGLGSSFGSGTALELARKLRNRAKAAERREAKRNAEFEARQAAMAAELAQWRAAHAELLPAVERFSAFMICDHMRAEGGVCYRELCMVAVNEAREAYSPTLLDLAYQATYRALEADQMQMFVELIAKNEVREAKRAAAAERAAAKTWIGREGERVTVSGTLAEPRHFDTEIGYGRTSTSTLYKLTTAEGNTVTWFRTGFHMFEAGTTATLTGCVKALKESEKYGKETQLTRCKIS